ncbi:MAG TPA: DUF2752 domain-containing protein [Candidatus Limnocylindrales bacterium]|jgi:hypothetical protein|nr:DUF2752 domain-containing protein [Candidatus Limnocylindrales bacterium]
MTTRDGARLLLLAVAALPEAAVGDGPVICPFRRISGRPCPACGLTRSWRAALRLHGRDSVRHHPLGWLALAAAAWFALDDRADIRLGRADRRALSALGGVWLAVWLTRLSRPAR